MSVEEVERRIKDKVPELWGELLKSKKEYNDERERRAVEESEKLENIRASRWRGAKALLEEGIGRKNE